MQGLRASSLNTVNNRMETSGSRNTTLDTTEGSIAAGTTLHSFHFQAQYPVSQKALLVGYLTLWLKKCVVPSWPRDGISPVVLLPAVQLAFGKPLGLLPAMVCSIQHDLRKLTYNFCQKETVSRGGEQVEMPKGGPSPRVELPYTYLMA